MKLVDKINDTIDRDFSLRNLIKIILVMGIVWLFQSTSGIWLGILGKIWAVIMPFIVGFVIAYVLRSPIRLAEKHGITRNYLVKKEEYDGIDAMKFYDKSAVAKFEKNRKTQDLCR